jgi:hypothetical protein
MATRRRSGLDDVQLSTLREQMLAGKTPRVAVSGPQFPEGTHGQIVRIGDRATDGNDFITVRVKVDRVTDELQFAPAELTSTVPGAKPAPRPSAAGRRSRATTAPKLPAAPSATSQPDTARVETAKPAAVASSRPSKPAAASAASRPSAAAAPRRRPTAGKPAKPVTITIASSGSDWAVSVQRGTRILVKHQAITPGAVSAVGQMLGNHELIEAISEINDAARFEAEERAAKLRAELDAVEAMLATHKAPR